MRLRNPLLLMPAVFALWAIPAQAQVVSTPCPNGGIAPPPGSYRYVCGSIYKITSDGWKVPPFDTTVTYCPAGARPGTSSLCKGSGIRYYRDGYGATYAGYTIDRLDGARYWDIFMYSKDHDYGSATVPIRQVWIDGYYGLQMSGLGMPPRPLLPTHIEPFPGQTDAPSNFPLVWYSGIDRERRAWSSLISYDFYYRYWPYGTSEPSSYTRWAADHRCTPNSSGNCSTFISDMPPGNYRWYIVAKLDVSSSADYWLRPAIFTATTSPAYLGIGNP